MEREKIRELISKMTLEEKAGLCSGADFWNTKAIERLGIPAIMLSDGPVGLRKQEEKGDHMGMGDSIPAVCFPAGVLVASSFDRDLLKYQGETLGNECQAEHVSVLLGPAMNIKRSPLCGRNFEYYSEDPMVSSELAAAYIKGVQSKNVGTSPKHFLANNQEHRRMTSSSNVDERTLREIYLASFENAVKKGKPWTIMGAYNQINGTFATEHEEYLTKVLREEWGFDGFVVSDWGAVNERVHGLKAGMELEMPASNGINDRKIITAVQSGELEEEVLDRACERLLNVFYRYLENQDETAVFDREKDHEISRKIAEESMVLLKNEGILPLKEDAKIAFIGQYAKEPRYQGGGSSHIHSSKVVSAWDVVDGKENFVFAQGFTDQTDEIVDTLLTEAVQAAKKADAAVVFVGLPEKYESEGYDRTHMKLPENQNALIEAVCEVQENVVIILHNGSPVEMPWVEKVKGILESYLAGQAVGEAQCNILFGKVNPSGKLAETFPLRLEDNPTYFYYGKDGDQVEYREGVLVGYRYYDAKKIPVLFPFGHGLSYTEFAYSDLHISTTEMSDKDTVQVYVTVTNTGTCAGKEIVQLYVEPKNPSIIRPVKELRGFEKIALKPGESKEIVFELDKRAFAYWNSSIHDWYAETGEYEIQIGKSSRDIVLNGIVTVKAIAELPYVFTKNTAFGDLLARPEKMQKLMAVFAQNGDDRLPHEQLDGETAGEGAGNMEMVKAMMQYMPIRAMTSFTGMEEEQIQGLLQILNED